jgi:NADH-quinone oxidoreductase subunit G
VVKPNETIARVMGGKQPNLLMDIHHVTEVNKVELSELPGPATNETFNGKPASTGTNVTDVKKGAGRNLAGTDSTNPNV